MCVCVAQGQVSALSSLPSTRQGHEGAIKSEWNQTLLSLCTTLTLFSYTKHKIKTVFVFCFCLHNLYSDDSVCVSCYVLYIMSSVTKWNQIWPHQSLISQYGKTRNRIHMPLHELLCGLCPFLFTLLGLEKFVRRVCELDQQDWLASLVTY